MTNFEKWKSELTPEKIAKLLDSDDICFECPVGSECWGYGSCPETFLEWANKEGEEE